MAGDLRIAAAEGMMTRNAPSVDAGFGHCNGWETSPSFSYPEDPMCRSFLLVELLTSLVLLCLSGPAGAEEVVLSVRTPMSPSTWALLERELLRANAAACREFYERYFDERGYLLCVERWGGDDGPDDAIENCTDWPILHAL